MSKFEAQFPSADRQLPISANTQSILDVAHLFDCGSSKTHDFNRVKDQLHSDLVSKLKGELGITEQAQQVRGERIQDATTMPAFNSTLRGYHAASSKHKSQEGDFDSVVSTSPFFSIKNNNR